MVCLPLTVFLVSIASLQACTEPVNVHIKNYEGPIILHTAKCDNQPLGNIGNQCHCTCSTQSLGSSSNQPVVTCGNQPIGYYGNQYNQPGCYEKECNCVSKQNYVATYGGSGCCQVTDTKPLVYYVCNSGCNGYSNCGGNQGQGYQGCTTCYAKTGC